MPAAIARSPDCYGLPLGEVRPPLAEAERWCQQFARQHAENFPVASWLLPRHLRQPLANIYAWCRWADDLADEAGDAEKSLTLLDAWESQLDDCVAGEAEHPIYVALAETLRKFDLPRQPFLDLIAAFGQDQRHRSYESFDQLLAYCRLSANPVGRLVLRLGHCESAEAQALSDSICTGLQLVNFWQDVRRDWEERRRIYLPRVTMRKFHFDEAVIAKGHADEPFRRAIAFEIERAEGLLRAGWPLMALVSPELRIDVELFIRSGLAVAAAIRRQRFDVLSRRPTVGKAQKLQLFAAVVLRQRLLRRDGAPA
jgi:squalene synthase HpnC